MRSDSRFNVLELVLAIRKVDHGIFDCRCHRGVVEIALAVRGVVLAQLDSLDVGDTEQKKCADSFV